MSTIVSALYMGTVVHKRLRPHKHALKYSVFSCLFDCSDLARLDKQLKLFSYNRFNLFSLYDSDHADAQGLQGYLQSIKRQSGFEDSISRFMMLCYPRILGYVFNPLTVYFGLDTHDRVRLIIYEVRNTFGERMSYVLPAQPDSHGLVTQECEKRLYVSPFNAVEGRYRFHTTSLASEQLTVGVALKTQDGPLLKTHFRGTRRALTDRTLLRALGTTGWMTVKVMAGIHYEALRLWFKGMKLVRHPRSPSTLISYPSASKETN